MTGINATITRALSLPAGAQMEKPRARLRVKDAVALNGADRRLWQVSNAQRVADLQRHSRETVAMGSVAFHFLFNCPTCVFTFRSKARLSQPARAQEQRETNLR